MFLYELANSNIAGHPWFPPVGQWRKQGAALGDADRRRAARAGVGGREEAGRPGWPARDEHALTHSLTHALTPLARAQHQLTGQVFLQPSGLPLNMGLGMGWA